MLENKNINPVAMWSQSFNMMNEMAQKMWEVNKVNYKNIESINEQFLNAISKTMETSKKTQEEIKTSSNSLGDQFFTMVEQFVKNQQSQMDLFTNNSEQLMKSFKDNWEQTIQMTTEMSKQYQNPYMFMPLPYQYLELQNKIDELNQKITDKDTSNKSKNNK
ncbi:hypothetical protein SYNTR_1228 [Candidatus Syntrophocurvum alkaliphilum]|uniref:Phasin domain-containing protein n=1 Tax=Candidatus Syntrophocurvum alkaliphilum TaxID=2293317 RepID=A0A6I6DKJ6_9FIRM|nr:hypothetical protein [Candidatus Syntrophocurvum alkaliphilum]QGT99821.1 hypothetical protein SYNTR_1228 [Candidatus Syntrophocurvum alkaliphilum]